MTSGSKSARKYMDWLKDNPADNSVQKAITIGVGSTEDGDILAISISQIMPGKEKEALEITAKMNMYFSYEIEDYKAKSEDIWDLGEVYKII